MLFIANFKKMLRYLSNLFESELFSFSKIWIIFIQFDLRQKNVDEMRKILKNAFSLCPKDKLFNIYLNIEYLLGNIKSVRILYQNI